MPALESDDDLEVKGSESDDSDIVVVESRNVDIYLYAEVCFLF